METIAAFKLPLSEHIFRLLRHRIITFRRGYCPGDQLNSDEIAEELKVSRTPVTQAFQRLMFDGLVAVEPRKGTFVRQLSPEDVEALFELLGHLEMVSLRLSDGQVPEATLERLTQLVNEAEGFYRAEELEAYLESDMAFHREIGCVSANKKLQEVYIMIQNQIYLASAYKAVTPGDADTALRQHRELIDMLRSCSPAQIEQAVVEHWRDSYRRYCVAHSYGDASNHSSSDKTGTTVDGRYR
jgi:DNA-binding GntR family transcriptional regulator